MKKRNKIILIIVLGILGIGVGIGLWQYENIKAIIGASTYSKEELADEIRENKEEVDKVLEDYDLPIIRDLTFGEEELIRQGKLTPKEAIEKLIKQEKANTSQEKTSLDTAKKEDSKKQDPKEEAKDKIAQYITQMYVLKAEYLGELGAFESRGIADYKALPKEQHNLRGKQKIISKYLRDGVALEAQCDSQVEGILESLEAECERSALDKDIVNKMRKAYQNEKRLKKSYYLSLINK